MHRAQWGVAIESDVHSTPSIGVAPSLGADGRSAELPLIRPTRPSSSTRRSTGIVGAATGLLVPPRAIVTAPLPAPPALSVPPASSPGPPAAPLLPLPRRRQGV